MLRIERSRYFEEMQVKRLRHPIRAIREPFGTAGLIVACVALVLAMGGAAVAAKGGLTGKQKKEVAKIARKEATKIAKTGPQGPTGPAGAKGDKGDAGAAGVNGTNGVDGTSPVGTKFTGAKGGCTEGGVEFEGANTTFACNGTTGFTKTLPSGKTETGSWVTTENASGQQATASFAIPLAAPLDEDHVAFVAKEAPVPAECDNGEGEAASPANPEADAGYLCVFAGPWSSDTLSANIINPTEEAIGAAKTGAWISAAFEGIGSWAVTAP